MKRVLQRLTESLRRQDWTGVAIEFAIVVLGVYVGIQAANWNQQRHDRAEERRFYRQLIGDLRADLRNFESVRRRTQLFDASAERVLVAVKDGLGPNYSRGGFASDVTFGGYLAVPAAATRTIDELTSTGSIGLLRDEHAKAEISSYYRTFEHDRQWDVLLRQQQAAYWQATAGVLPRKALQATVRGREPNISEAEADEILERVRARPLISDLLKGMAAHQERVRRDSEAQERSARELIRLLQPLAGEN
jgi:hypothetical protein